MHVGLTKAISEKTNVSVFRMPFDSKLHPPFFPASPTSPTCLADFRLPSAYHQVGQFLKINHTSTCTHTHIGSISLKNPNNFKRCAIQGFLTSPTMAYCHS